MEVEKEEWYVQEEKDIKIDRLYKYLKTIDEKLNTVDKKLETILKTINDKKSILYHNFNYIKGSSIIAEREKNLYVRSGIPFQFVAEKTNRQL